MKLDIECKNGICKIVNAETGEAVENVVHVRFEIDVKHGWLGYIIIAPDVSIEGDFQKTPVMPVIRGYEREHK